MHCWVLVCVSRFCAVLRVETLRNETRAALQVGYFVVLQYVGLLVVCSSTRHELMGLQAFGCCPRS
jgi:hypothetical protein